MRSLVWTASDAMWVEELDGEHKEIVAAVAGLMQATASEAMHAMQRLAGSVADHFAHEERLMRAARYEGMAWHKQQHDAARRRLQQFATAVARGEASAAAELTHYLTEWLRRHTRIADRMLGAFLRNRRRCVKLTIRVGTRAADACEWVDAQGERFDPER